MPDPSPAATVVIPSHNRGAVLAKTLGALAEQTTSEPFEVIVALDACTDDSAAVLDKLETTFPLRWIAGEWCRASAARNAAAREARGRVIIFLDDDIVVGSGFVDGHLKGHELAEGRRVVIGYSKPVIAHEETLFSQALRRWWEDLFTEMGAEGHRYTFRDFLSGNVSVARSTFLEADGFDESFTCREDYELGYRLLRAGCDFAYAADAVGLHHDARSLGPSLNRAQAEGRADVQFLQKHPELLAELIAAWPTGRTMGERILIWLPFRSPAAARGLQALIAGLLSPLETIHARRLWARLQQAARRLSYMRGVASSGINIRDYRELIEQRDAAVPPVLQRSGPEDWPTCANDIDLERPQGLTVDFYGMPIIHSPPLVGAEPVRARHVIAMANEPYGCVMDRARRAMSEMSVARLHTGQNDATAELISLVDVQLSPRGQPHIDPVRLPARFLVRLGARPLGWLSLPATSHPEDLARILPGEMLRHLRDPIAAAAVMKGVSPPTSYERVPISVVVCTRDRVDNLRRCLAALQRIEYDDWELIVVDNAPSSDATWQLVKSIPTLRYVREDAPGLDNARNRGIRESRNEIVVFTDDDTMVDPGWLQAIARSFADPEVAAMTGLVAPMKLDTPARIYFEDVYGGMGKGFHPRWFRKADLGSAGQMWASACGVGANMAFRRSTFAAVGLFDPHLDVGTPTRGGGDIEMFHRVIAADLLLKYDPNAVIWHEHRESWEALRRQLADNSCSFVCYLLTIVRRGSITRGAAFKFALTDWLGRWFALRYLRPGAHRRDMIRSELRGVLDGIGAYRRAQAMRRL